MEIFLRQEILGDLLKSGIFQMGLITFHKFPILMELAPLWYYFLFIFNFKDYITFFQ